MVGMEVTEDTGVGEVATPKMPGPRKQTASNFLQTRARAIDIERWTPDSGKGHKKMMNIKVVTWSLAIWSAFTFVFCVVYGLVTPASVHMTAFLQQILPGFEPNSWRGFGIGLVESFLYGAYAGLVYVPINNFLHRRWGRQ